MHEGLAGFAGSGDLLADRRFDYAMALAEAGAPDEAADLMRQALEIVPDWAAGWFALGDLLHRAGDGAGARAAFERCLALSPEDTFGAGPRLAALGAAAQPAALPQAYVRALFDQYAPRFDRELVEGLAYRAPWRLRTMIEAETARTQLARVLDLGCGTGLMGEALRRNASWLVGVDLSPGMVAAAEAKRIYDELVAADLNAFLKAAPAAQFDLIAAADVFVYLGDLAPLFGKVTAFLAPGGRFAFSCEVHEGDGFVLRESLRFAHAESYVRACLAGAGLAVRHIETGPCRLDRGEEVAGLFVIAERPAESEAALLARLAAGRARSGSEDPRPGA